MTMSNYYVQNFTMSFQNLLPRANSAYVSVTDKSTVTHAYPLTIIQEYTFSPVYHLSLPFVWNHGRDSMPEQYGLYVWWRFGVPAVFTQNVRRILLTVNLEEFHELYDTPTYYDACSTVSAVLCCW